jgi:hypothetical protein
MLLQFGKIGMKKKAHMDVKYGAWPLREHFATSMPLKG